MSSQKVVKEFRYKGRRCVIIEINRTEPNLGRLFLEGASGIDESYCNGYIELKDSEVLKDYDKYDIESDEITYQGDLKFYSLDASDGKTYIGFDTAHSWNTPESKTAEAVEKICKRIVNELNKK